MSAPTTVAAPTIIRRSTLEELEALDPDGKHFELYDGVLREVEGVSEGHGSLGANLLTDVNNHVRKGHLGRVYTPDTQFVVDPSGPTVLLPDISFVATEHLTPREMSGKPVQFAPDLAIEIVSPSNRGPELLDKVARYLRAGTRLVWLVRGETQTITVFSADTVEKVLHIGDILDGGDVLPGFQLALADLFFD